MSHLPATILIDSGAMVYTTSSNVKQKAGVPWTWLPTLPSPPIPYLPCVPCMGRGRASQGIVLSSLPSPRCRRSVARVEDQDRLAGVWRRLWCAEEADVRCRMNPVCADHTATQRPPSSTGRASSSDAAAGERAGQAKGKYRGFIVGSLLLPAYYSGRRISTCM